MGRKDSNNWSGYANVEGIYFDDVSTGTNTNMAKKVSDLTDMGGQYKIPKEKVCFLYNKNSGIGEAELGELNDILSLGHDPLNSEASRGGENASIKLADAFSDIPAGAKAVILSADPYFTRHMSEIVRLAAKNSNQFMLCYPLLDYGDEAGAVGMSTAQFMARGPRLKDVGDATKGLYLALGELAGARLAAPGGQYSFKPAAQGYIGLP
ncbi:MAG: hypothetical protein E6G96_19955 [Alphaproteobacteria bacterium]|nr:MAG: hypothetical protein E6G96_19955 [Alphaproteobacteria bacterium]